MSRTKNKMNFHSTCGVFNSFARGGRCFYKSILPEKEDEKNKLSILFLHDLTDYHKRYEDVGIELMQALNGSIDVHFLDFIGHGMSSGTRGHIESFDVLCRDVVSFVNQDMFQIGNRELVVFAHGLGGLVILKVLEEYSANLKKEISSIVLVNPFIKLQLELPSFLDFLGDKNFLRLKRLKYKWPFHGFDLCGNPQFARDYDGDPLVLSQLSASFFKEVQAASRSVRNSSYFIDSRTLFQISNSSDIARQETTKLFQKGMPKEKSRILEYSGAPHFIYHSSERDNAIKDSYNWLKENLI